MAYIYGPYSKRMASAKKAVPPLMAVQTVQ